MSPIHEQPSGTLPLNTSHWFAWVDRMPPAPGSFHVTGVVVMPSPGYDVRLVPSSQGPNPTELVLELQTIERPGPWPEVVTPVTVRYDVDPYSGTYETVLVQLPSGLGIPLDVEETF